MNKNHSNDTPTPRFSLPSPHSGPCHNHLSTAGFESVVSRVLVPTIINTREDGSIMMKWNCSMGRSCCNRMCYYARGERDEPV